MANDAFTQQALAADRRFQTRLQNALTKVAWQVLEEQNTVPNHAARAQYAHQVVNNPTQQALSLAPSFVNRPNVINFATTYDFAVGGVVTSAADADLESQLNTDWNELSGVI